MQCPRCQAENREGARFCRECGATFGAVCSSCGAKVEAGSKFCDGCGAPLVATPVPGLGPSRFASPESERLREGLARLQTTEFLYEARLFPEVEYTFKHALTHEVAYAGLLHDRAKTLHVRALEAIERLYQGRLDEHVERLAHHASRGEVWGKALSYFRQAGAKAYARSANWEAVACLEHLGEAYAASDPLDAEKAENHYRQAVALATELGMRPLLAHCHLGLGKLYRRTRKLQEAEANLTIAITMYREMDMRFWLEQAEAIMGALP